jgi:thiamine biosynthesis lipoprotein
LALLAPQVPAESPKAQQTVSSPILRFEESLDAMGTTTTIAAYGYDRFKLQAAVAMAFDEMRRLEDLLSNYRPESEWSRMNRTAAERPFKVSKELFDLLARCMQYSSASDGAFDITVGPLMKVWGFYKGSGRFPHRAEIRGAMAHVGYKKVELDPQNLTVHFQNDGMSLDPGGIGKGYAVDRMADILRSNGVQSALITAGSSSIYAIGAPPSDARGWHVAIRHPKDARKTVQDVYLRDESMSTSGSYEKFFWANGRIYSHIMDPRTGYPAEGMLSASVIAPRTIDSEAWTKPYFINGRRWAAANKIQGSRVYLCENGSEPKCAWLQ